MLFHAHSLRPGFGTSPCISTMWTQRQNKSQQTTRTSVEPQSKHNLNRISFHLSSYVAQIWLLKDFKMKSIKRFHKCICNALLYCMGNVSIYIFQYRCGVFESESQTFLNIFALLILGAEQQQCVAYSSQCFLKCPSAKLKQMRWHSARTNLNSAMTQIFCPKTLAGFCHVKLCWTCLQPKSSSYAHFSKAREEKPQMPKAKQQVSLFTEKTRRVLLHQQQYCQ